MTKRYQVGVTLRQTCEILDISPERVLRRAGLSETLAADDDLSVGAEQFFRLWQATCDEAERPGLVMDLAMSYAHGPFIPPVFAFSCANTLALGLTRLAVFKPILGPIRLDITRPEGALNLAIRPTDSGLAMPAPMALFELLYITECARTFTGTGVTPIALSLPTQQELDPACLDYLGSVPAVTGVTSLTFASEDADLPLVTRSAALWKTLEPGLLEQLEEQSETATMAGRIKHALAEALPGGSSSVEDMARRLNVSKRSLQRRLAEEGTSFQELLNETRFEMSKRYLKDSELSLPEISFLLGFGETSSFFRAFQGWTGTTPGNFRAETAPDIGAQRH